VQTEILEKTPKHKNFFTVKMIEHCNKGQGVSILGDFINLIGHTSPQLVLAGPTLNRGTGLDNIQRSLSPLAIVWFDVFFFYCPIPLPPRLYLQHFFLFILLLCWKWTRLWILQDWKL